MGLRYSIITIILIIVSAIIYGFFLILKRKSEKIYFFSNLKILNKLKKNNNFNPLKKFISVFSTVLIIVIIIILSILTSRPYEKQELKYSKSGIDIIILLDVSLSMEEADFEPNRFIASKNSINKFLDSLTSDRVGFVIFRGQTYTLAPLTYDYGIIKYYLDELNVSMLPKDDTVEKYIELHGTAIGDGIISSSLKFQENDEREKVIILFTDGVKNMGYDPIESAEIAKSKNIKIYSIYIGSPDDYLTFNEGEYGEGLSTVEEISEITGGKAFQATDNDAMDNILSEIQQLEKQDIEVETNTIKADQPMLLVTAFTLLLTIYFVSKSIFD